jgi:hypothetical protein
MVTGGETSGAAQSRAEGYDPDLSSWNDQGKLLSGRSHHTTVLTKDNYILNIGGWDGYQCLDTTDMAYFSPGGLPDDKGLAAASRRQPEISTATDLFNRGERATILSAPGNFHGLTEASGGGAGSMNSAHSNPRIYLQQIDNPSGFMLDLSTRIYSLYGGPNTDWSATLSSITVIAPSGAGELPYGYYHLRAAANGQFSEGHLVQVSIPRPSGLAGVPTAQILGATSVQWTWGAGDIANADGFAVFSATNGVYLGTAPFGATGAFLQTGLASNTGVSIAVGGFNLGGYGGLRTSATYYTMPTAPKDLTVDYASFQTVRLTWSPNGNSPSTYYEVSVSVQDNFATFWTPVPFSNMHTSTSATLSSLSPDVLYYFRVQAINGNGDKSAFFPAGSPYVSTRTVGNISNLTGTPVSTASISWSWAPSAGTPSYNVYDITADTANPVFLASTTVNSYTQTGLNPNKAYAVSVNAFDAATQAQGPTSASGRVYTLAITPMSFPLEYTFTDISTGSVTVNWIANGNPDGTHYKIEVSVNGDFSGATVKDTTLVSSPFSPLMPNVRYFARVNALNEKKVPTDVLDLGSFYTRAQGPTNLRPDAISMSGVAIGWDTGENSPSTIYELRGSTTATGLDTGVNISTYIPFSLGFTGNSFALNGLLTSTIYYFDVAARNAAGVATQRVQATPSAFTLPGPNGAPTGSVGGTSNPVFDTIISGVLPNARSVALGVPALSFAAQTPIAISSSATNSCRQDIVGAMPLVEVAVYTQDGAQPQVPVTLTLNYNNSEAAKITPNISKLVLARYNPVSGECLPLETTVDPGVRTITARLNHFSLFQLILKNPATDMSAVRVYPNPFYTNRGQGFVTIDNMPAETEVRIYTLSGEKVWEGKAGSSGILTWDAANSSGVLVGSGIYLAVLKSEDDKKVVKLAVER